MNSCEIFGEAFIKVADILIYMVHNYEERIGRQSNLNSLLNPIYNNWKQARSTEYSNDPSKYYFRFDLLVDNLIKSPFYKNCEQFIQRFIRSGLKQFLNACVYRITKTARNIETEDDIFNIDMEFYARVVSNCFKNIDETISFHTIHKENIQVRSQYGYNVIVDTMLQDFPEDNTISKILLPLCGNIEHNYSVEAFKMLFEMDYYTTTLNNDIANRLSLSDMITADDIYLDNNLMIPMNTGF